MAASATTQRAITLHELPHATALAEAVAAAVRDAVLAGVAQRGQASLVVTGGSTPRAYYPRLAALDLPWSQVTLTLSDERWVGLDHPESNEALVRSLLLTGPASAARFVPLRSLAASPEQGAADVARGLRTLPHPYDLVLLGFGADTHIASLFPGAAAFDAGVDAANESRCLAVTPPAGISPALPRLSLTLNEILASRRIVIAASGGQKRQALETALAGRWPQPSPIPLLAQRATQPIDFFWTP